ncbi:hypothetical protein QTP88_011522 [Uroleucon formosanum]
MWKAKPCEPISQFMFSRKYWTSSYRQHPAKYLQVPTDYNFLLCSAAVYRVMYAPRSYHRRHLDRGSSGFPSGPVPVTGTLETRGGDYRGPVNFDWRKNVTEMTARQ